jgi:hypothetical protein
LDIRPFIDGVQAFDNILEMKLLMTTVGTARPDEVLALLGLKDLWDQGGVLSRINLELADEVGSIAPAADLQPEPARLAENTQYPPLLPRTSPTAPAESSGADSLSRYQPEGSA